MRNPEQPSSDADKSIDPGRMIVETENKLNPPSEKGNDRIADVIAAIERRKIAGTWPPRTINLQARGRLDTEA